MKTYSFYNNDEHICDVELLNDDAANEKAEELMYALSLTSKNVMITYKEACNEQKII